jgi:hypothetical protein
MATSTSSQTASESGTDAIGISNASLFVCQQTKACRLRHNLKPITAQTCILHCLHLTFLSSSSSTRRITNARRNVTQLAVGFLTTRCRSSLCPFRLPPHVRWRRLVSHASDSVSCSDGWRWTLRNVWEASRFLRTGGCGTLRARTDPSGRIQKAFTEDKCFILYHTNKEGDLCLTMDNDAYMRVNLFSHARRPTRARRDAAMAASLSIFQMYHH